MRGTDEYSDFKDKRVVITGAAGIFGTWIAEAFARHGARICITDVRAEKLRALAKNPAFNEIELLTVHADLMLPDSIKMLSAEIEKKWGTADILVNNAGLYPRRTLLDASQSDWDEIITVNLTAPFLLTQTIAKQMISENVKGSIINISSGAAVGVKIGGAIYSTSKAALAMLTRGWALELAPYGIRVNSVAPGFAPGSEVSLLSDDYISQMIATIPIGRTSGPSDAPEAILFLCSSKASFITGALLNVDGGRVAGTYKKDAVSPTQLRKED
jgi:3-oxoacyl-[acyl-carrier protein] reductase